MRQDDYEKYLEGRDLADKTRSQRIYALKRIETRYEIDLDKEYERDGLREVFKGFTYSKSDSLAGAPNPSRMDIDQGKLKTHLAWYKSHLNDYLRFCGGVVERLSDEEEVEAEDLIEAASQTFGLEKDLQSALRKHLDQLESGLKVDDGGAEKKVEAGFIDILATDQQGNPVVIELKAGTSKPDAVAQILAYMGCIAGETSKPVRGILVAGEHHPRVSLAAQAVPNLTLKTYGYRFEFK